MGCHRERSDALPLKPIIDARSYASTATAVSNMTRRKEKKSRNSHAPPPQASSVTFAPNEEIPPRVKVPRQNVRVSPVVVPHSRFGSACMRCGPERSVTSSRRLRGDGVKRGMSRLSETLCLIRNGYTESGGSSGPVVFNARCGNRVALAGREIKMYHLRLPRCVDAELLIFIKTSLDLVDS